MGIRYSLLSIPVRNLATEVWISLGLLKCIFDPLITRYKSVYAFQIDFSTGGRVRGSLAASKEL